VVTDASKAGGGGLLEPPKFITSKHVAAVFERLGLDPAGGIKVFQALCEALSRRDTMYRKALNEDSEASSSAAASAPPSPVAPRATAAQRNAALTAMVLDEEADEHSICSSKLIYRNSLEFS
jgi:hypothetical protein